MTVRLGFRQGLLSDLANPKIGVFFTSLLPQFVSGREPVLVPAKISDVLTRPGVKAALDRVTGVVLIGLGVRLALERR